MNNLYRRVSAALLATGMVVIPSCGKKDQDPVPSSSQTVTEASSAVSTSGQEPTEQTTEVAAPAPVLAYTGQLEVIAASKSTWYAEGDSEMRYAVTDLDMNGRYEITAAKLNKSFAMYEVNADKNGLTKVNTPFESGSPGPYIEEEYDLRQNSDGDYIYVAKETEDSLNEGETTIYYYVLSLANGQLRANQIATEIRSVDADGNESVRYGDDEFEISAAEFKSKTDTGLPKILYKQKVSWLDGAAVAGMDDAKSLEAICFKLVK